MYMYMYIYIEREREREINPIQTSVLGPSRPPSAEKGSKRRSLPWESCNLGLGFGSF